LKSESIFNSAPEFCFTFHFQIYFLIVLQYLTHKKRIQNSYKVAGITNISILIFCIIFCVLSLNTDIVFKDYREAINKKFEVSGNKVAINLILFWLMSLQIPFKFFLEKEFIFILYDELKSRSISSKVTEIQNKLFAA
jgi:hypothetical protein